MFWVLPTNLSLYICSSHWTKQYSSLSILQGNISNFSHLLNSCKNSFITVSAGVKFFCQTAELCHTYFRKKDFACNWSLLEKNWINPDLALTSLLLSFCYIPSTKINFQHSSQGVKVLKFKIIHSYSQFTAFFPPMNYRLLSVIWNKMFSWFLSPTCRVGGTAKSQLGIQANIQNKCQNHISTTNKS